MAIGKGTAASKKGDVFCTSMSYRNSSISEDP